MRVLSEEAYQLWDEMGRDKSWASLMAVLRNHKFTPRGMDNDLVDVLLDCLSDLPQSDIEFPDSPQELHRQVNLRLEDHPVTPAQEADSST